eukprot:3092270-Prymnesium_polylepis.1
MSWCVGVLAALGSSVPRLTKQPVEHEMCVPYTRSCAYVRRRCVPIRARKARYIVRACSTAVPPRSLRALSSSSEAGLSWPDF